MTIVVADRVRDTTTSTGTTAVTLSGTAPTGFQTFSAIGNNQTYYDISDQSGPNWETGIGTYNTSTLVLTRDTVLGSSNGGALVNFTVGTKDVICTYVAGKAVTTDTLAYPPAIGSTTPAAGSFTTLRGGAGSANYGQLTGGATTKAIQFQSLGSDTNVGINLVTKGTGSIALQTGATTATQFQVIDFAGATNYIQVNGGLNGGAARLSVSGTGSTEFQQSSLGVAAIKFFSRAFGAEQFRVADTGSAVNNLQVTGAVTTATPALSAIGSDTNINLALTPKGTGTVQFGTYTASVLTPTGYITITDAGGTTRRLLVG